MNDLGLLKHADAIVAALGSVSGLDVVDVGCGEGANARILAANGANVTGVDPFMEPADWKTEGSGRYRLLKSPADALPLDDHSADLVIFVFSLHHVPNEKLAKALAEARRVLKPTGRLYVAEPLAEGPNHYVSAPYHDETAVRAAARSALDAFAAPHFTDHRHLAYADRRPYNNFDDYAKRMIANRRFNGYSEEAVLAPEVRRRFDEVFASGKPFDQPVRIDLFSQPNP
ncbi:MAG TPA: class I SAM-dependent methyltransferase [Candidatus Baltobacteraceae bacterium]|nr:class I SAM-dependent methyltransferase [Candidatus Baltobacteraceae bacterium]